MAFSNIRKMVLVETAEERRALINEIKNGGFPVQVYSEKDFNEGKFKKPFNIYTHICYCNVLVNYDDAENFGKPTQCKIIYASKDPEKIYYISLLDDKSYEINDDMRNTVSSEVLQSAKALRKIVKDIEEEFNTKISVDKETSHKLIEHIETPKPYKNSLYDGQTTSHVYGYDLNSAYSAYIKKYGLNWCTIPDVDYHGREVTINAAVNKKLCDYIDKWFLLKHVTIAGAAHTKAKRMLNLITGHIRNINPFVYRELKWGVQNKIIDVLMQQCNKPVIYSNIDSIYTIGKSAILDAQLGSDIGQFKLEHEDCNFTWQWYKMNYQINDEYPVARGIPKNCFKMFETVNGRPFKLNQDAVPTPHYYKDWTLKTF